MVYFDATGDNKAKDNSNWSDIPDRIIKSIQNTDNWKVCTGKNKPIT